MRDAKRWMLCLVMMFMISACTTKEEEPKDFWAATVAVLEDKIESNGYEQGNWQIGVEDPSRAKDKEHRSFTIRQVMKNETVMFSLQNKDRKSIQYILKTSKKVDDYQYDETITITSTDEQYKNYTISYVNQEFRYGNFYDQKEATGEIAIQEGGTITYDNVPKLKETIRECASLIENFEKEFKIEYKSYDFVPLPYLMKDMDIPQLKEIPREAANTMEYYSEPRINARGYSFVTGLSVDKNYQKAELGVYNIEHGAYDSRVDVTMEKRKLDNCYNLMQMGDPDVSYAVYLDGETAYLYLQSKTDDEIYKDIMETSGSNASYILKITNKSYQ